MECCDLIVARYKQALWHVPSAYEMVLQRKSEGKEEEAGSER